MSAPIPTPTSRRSALVSAAFVAGVTLAGPAAAVDPVTGYWNGPDDFGYSVPWMPDIDQQWFTLPNGGAMYCAPTASMNMLAFAAHWGDDLLQPGPGVWEDDYVTEQWDLADQLENLGFLMLTSPTGGTTLGNTWSGLDLWIGQRPFDVFIEGRVENDYPTLSDVVNYGAAGGGSLVAIGFGRYDWDSPGGTTRLVDRQGGHMVTVRSASSQNGVETFIVRDPSSGDTTIEQSPYATRTFTGVSTRTVLNDADGDQAFSPATATTLGLSGSGRLQVIDGIIAIAPSFAGGFQGGNVVFEPIGGINGFGGDDDGLDVAMPADVEPLDMAVVAGGRTVLVLWRRSDGATELVRVAAGRTPEVLVSSFDRQPTSIEIDRHGRILAADGPTLLQFVPGRPGSAPGLEPVLVAGHAIGAIVVDDADDRVLLVEDDGRSATIVDLQAPGGPQPVALLLPAVQAAREAARRSGAAAAGDDRFFVVDHGAEGDRLVAVRILPGGVVETAEAVPAVPGRRFASLAVDRRGHLVTTDESGGLTVFAEGPGGFDPVDDDWYVAAAGLEGLVLSRSRTNVVPGLHDGPGWENIDPAELEPGVVTLDCHADIDEDGQVGLGDLLRVLAGWEGEGPADIMPLPGGDGVIDFADLLAVLGAWGPCP